MAAIHHAAISRQNDRKQQISAQYPAEMGEYFTNRNFFIGLVAKAMQHFGRTYLVDVLQRISSISIHDVDQLMPRIWKEKFAQDPLTSDLLRE